MRYLYREKRIYSGDFMEVEIYPVFKTAKGRKKKAKPSSEVQRALNLKNSVKKLTRLLHSNFTSKDLEVHLTYEESPADEAQAIRDIQNYIKRLKRVYKKQDVEFKYIYVIEASSTGRFHFHMTFSGGVDRDTIENAWGKGYANTKRLQFNEHGIIGLAHYITKEPIASKRWSASRNIKKPVEKTNDYKLNHKKVAAMCREKENREFFENMYKGYFFVEATDLFNELNRSDYLSLLLYKKSAKIMRS